MPYVKLKIRRQLDTEYVPTNPGELNYAITKLIRDYALDREALDGESEGGLSYRRINDVLGALEGAKQEFYRRVAVPYETRKINENGDVYPT